MSLVKKPRVTAKKAAASRRNGNLSHGPATQQGKARVGAAHLRHGFYAKAEDATLRSFGEDPAELEDLLAGLHQEFAPSSSLQKRLVKRLAQVLLVMDRSHRAQEGQALRRARQAGSGRETRLHARMMRLKMTAETLRSLARAVNGWHYVTDRDDLEIMKKLQQEGVMAEMGDIALDLFYQLQEPGTDQDGVSEDEKNRRVVNSVRSMFGLKPIENDVEMLTPEGKTLVVHAHDPAEADVSSEEEEGEDAEKDDRYPNISKDDWRARERARKLLKNILTRQAEGCEAQRKVLLHELLEGPSPYELAAEIAPNHAEAWVVRRTQDANLREVRRITSLLLRIKREECKQDLQENKDS